MEGIIFIVVEFTTDEGLHVYLNKVSQLQVLISLGVLVIHSDQKVVRKLVDLIYFVSQTLCFAKSTLVAFIFLY